MSEERTKRRRRFGWKAVTLCVVLLLGAAVGLTLYLLPKPLTAADRAAAQVSKEEYAKGIGAKIVESMMNQDCGRLKSTDVQGIFDEDKPRYITDYSDKPGGTPQAMADLHDEALEIRAGLATICPQYMSKDSGSTQRMLDATANVKVVDRTPEQIIRDNVPQWANESDASMDDRMHSICASLINNDDEDAIYREYMAEGLSHNQARITALQSTDAFCVDSGSGFYSPDGTDTPDDTGSTNGGSSAAGEGSYSSSSGGSTVDPVLGPTDSDFVATLRNSDSSFRPMPASTLISVAHQACSSMESGSTPQGVGAVAMLAGMTERQSAEFVGAAIAAYCPSFADQVGK